MKFIFKLITCRQRCFVAKFISNFNMFAILTFFFSIFVKSSHKEPTKQLNYFAYIGAYLALRRLYNNTRSLSVNSIVFMILLIKEQWNNDC